MINRQYNDTQFITGLRFIAIFGVFLIHSGGGGLREFGSLGNNLVDMGKYGVDMFFVISGFTIFYQIFDKGYSFKNFLKIRLLRLSLPYFPLLLLSFYIYFEQMAIETLIGHILYLGYLVPDQKSILGVEWSLSVEVFYYILIGFIITKYSKYFNKIIILAISTIVLYILAKHYGRYIDVSALLHYILPFQYGYMFMLGGLAYFLRTKIDFIFYNPKVISDLFIVSLLGIWFLNLFFDLIGKGALTYAIITFFCIVFIKDDAKMSILLTNKIFIFFGSISFSLYLIHPLVLGQKINIISSVNDSFLFIQNFLILVILSSIWYFIFEYKIYKKLKVNILESKNDNRQ